MQSERRYPPPLGPPFAPSMSFVALLTISAFTVAIMTVLQFPPRLSRRTDVIIEFRYGMCCLVKQEAKKAAFKRGDV